MSPSRKTTLVTESRTLEPQHIPAPNRAPPAAAVQAPSMRLVQPEPQSATEPPLQQPRELSPELIRGPTPVLAVPKEQKPGGAISKMLRSASSSASDPKPEKTKKAKSRVELDDFDSSTDTLSIEEPQREPPKQRSNAMEERLSESPVQVSPISLTQFHPPALMIDTSSQEEPTSPASSPSPELIDADDARGKNGSDSAATSTPTPTWSNNHLRTFFDDDADIKDLLVVVYDKSEVVPAGPDHPITGNLFKDENAKLADITNRLDGMLGDWLARKMRTQASR